MEVELGVGQQKKLQVTNGMEVGPRNPSKYDKPIDTTRNWLIGPRDQQAKSVWKKYGLFVVWCKQKQLAKAYWHGAIRVLWKGLCPKINGQSSDFLKQLSERLRA